MAQTTRTFRIFVSSTFSDLKEERNALQREVFPRLRELCLQHGCRFQAIDLRWGVRDEAGLDQQTMKICLDEVSRSQRASPRPNFIILLGDRYGWRPLPAEIPAREFEHIHETTTDASERQLLDAWYKRDDNACYKRDENSEQEGVYCLQPRSDRFADFQVWDSEVERPLRAILLRAIEGLELSDDERRKYEASATEQEIAAGALRVPDANEHVFCFFRSIRGLPRDQSARDFLDLDENWELDAKADTLLKKLKGELEKRLPDNIHSYEADWTGTGASTAHIGELPEKLEACLRLLDDPNSPETLCVDVWKRLASAILDETVRLGKIEPLEKEIFDHAEFGENRARAFIGRAAILQTISSYVSGSNRQPLCIWGESGSGKSALMAKAAAECGARNAESFIVSRFIGATPASSDGRSLLESICRQITRHYGGDETTIPTEYKELVKELSTRLSLATKDNPLILFLDALDQLSDADRAGNLIWLPAQLPENVRLIVSAVPGECLTALGRKLPAANIVRLEPMPASEGQYLLNRWLSQEGRTLQPHQELEVLTGFAESSRHKDEGSDAERGGEQGGLPLYLKLAFEEARRWKSYSPKVSLAPDIPGIIRQLFAWLSQDANHGAVVVSRSLGYLAASKNGLSEDEMLDILSRDKEVLDDFKSRARHTPPEERLPVIVWSRLYFDLEPYLSERSADGTSLLSFYHRQVEDAVKDNYLQDEPKRVRHRALAVYFDSQPLRIEKAGEQIPNVRKVSELPFQQTCGEMWEEIEATLCDLKFMETKCAAGMIYGLMDDYVAARSASGSRWSDSNRIADFERFLSHEAHFLRESPGLIYQQAYNTSSRLHVRAAAEELMRGRGFPGAAWLRKTAGTVAQKHGGKVISLAFWGDDSRLAVSTEAREVWVWDTERGDLWQRCDTPPSAVRSLSVSPNGKFLAGGYGSPEPSPFISGISVWETDGSSRCDFRVWEWVYSIRWESDSRLIAGAGMPSGAEAGGTVWVADLTTEECSLVKHFGSGSPVVFTSTVVSQDTPPRLIELTLSKRGGIGCVILDESASGPNPVSVEFTGESFSSSPRSAISIDNQTICMLTETAVYRVKLTAVGDRLLIEPRKLGESVISEPVCLAGSAASNEIVVGTAEGGAWIVPLEGDTAPHLIHEDVFSITAASFSSSGKRIALGNGAGQVFVYNRCDNDLVFHTEHEAALAARIEDSRAIILHGDHLVLASLSDTASKESIALSDSLFARDFDVLGDLAILICYPVKELTFATHRVIQVFHLVEKRLLLSLNISAVADALGSAETLLEPSRFRRIRLQPGHDSCHVLLGSAQGVMIYPLLAFETGVPLVVPCPPAVGILSPNTPAISCEVFEIGREPETVVAGYANKTEGSEIKLRGEFRVWDTRRNEHSPPQWLSAPVNAICQDTSGAVIVGTEDGEASSWQYDQEWRRLAIIEHGVPVVAVNFSHSGYMACSASEDGNLMIWDSRTGLHLLRTFLDVKPVAASFINEDAGLCIVDKMGEVHVWRIENGGSLLSRSGHLSTPPMESFRSAPGFPPSYVAQYLASAEAFECAGSQIEQGDLIQARDTLSAIADTPALALAKKDWLSRIDAAEGQAALPDTVRQALAELRESSQIWMRGSHDWSEERKMMDCLEALTREVRHLLEEGKAAEVGVLAEAMPEAAPNYILEARRTWMSITSRIEARREIEPDLNHLQRLASEGRLDEARTALETIPDASPEVRQIKKELLAQIEEAEQLREAIAAAVENGRNLAQEGRLAEARHEIEKLPDAPGHVLELKTALILQIDKIEQEHKSIQQALEESRRLAEEAQFDQARQVIETIHSTFVEVEQLKKELMVQIDEAEQFHKEIESTIEESQRLIKYGRIAEARQVIDRLPDTDALLEMKTNFLNQMDEMQQEYEKREADVSGMLDGLESIGVGRAGIEALARHNDVDLTNLWEFHAFLQAVTEQLPPSFRARMKSGADKPAKRKWLRFWRQ